MQCHLPAIISIACFITVTAASAQGTDTGVHEYKGKVVAGREAEVAPRIDALVDKIHFPAGKIVKEGELLFEFVPKSKEAALAAARAKKKLMDAQLALAEVKLKNAQTLRTRNASSEMQVLEAQAQRDIAVANVEEASAGVAIGEIALNQMKLFAPISGLISRPFIREGAYVTLEARDATRMAIIVQLDPIKVVGEVPFDVYLQRRKLFENREQAADKLRFTLILPDKQKYLHAGRLVAGSGEFDAATQMMSILVEFANPEFVLRPGLAVTLQSAAP